MGVPSATFGRRGRVFRTSLTLILLAQVVSINSTTFSAVDRFTGAPYPYADTWNLQVSGFFSIENQFGLFLWEKHMSYLLIIWRRVSIFPIERNFFLFLWENHHTYLIKNWGKGFNFSHRNACFLVSMGKIFKLPLKTFPISRNFSHRIVAFLIFMGKKQVYPPKN